MTDAENSLALFSINQAAKELKVGKKRIYEMIEKGEIGIIEFDKSTVKIPRSELARWVQEKTTYKQLTKLSNNGIKCRVKTEFDAKAIMQKIISIGGKIEQK